MISSLFTRGLYENFKKGYRDFGFFFCGFLAIFLRLECWRVTCPMSALRRLLGVFNFVCSQGRIVCSGFRVWGLLNNRVLRISIFCRKRCNYDFSLGVSRFRVFEHSGCWGIVSHRPSAA